MYMKKKNTDRQQTKKTTDVCLSYRIHMMSKPRLKLEWKIRWIPHRFVLMSLLSNSDDVRNPSKIRVENQMEYPPVCPYVCMIGRQVVRSSDSRGVRNI